MYKNKVSIIVMLKYVWACIYDANSIMLGVRCLDLISFLKYFLRRSSVNECNISILSHFILSRYGRPLYVITSLYFFSIFINNGSSLACSWSIS